MRSSLCIATAALACLVLTSFANATELQVFCPPLLNEGLTKLAVAYAFQTGKPVAIKSKVMGKLVIDARSGSPDLVMLPPDLMDSLDTDGGIKTNSRVPLARVEIALAVRFGAPHPDISTVEKTRLALNSATALVYSEPGPPRNSVEGRIIDALLKLPAFSAVHAVVVPQADGSGVSALARGDGDMTLQVIPEILPHKEVELVGPLPAELGAHIDTAVAISSHAADPNGAAMFLRYITRPEAKLTWKKAGIDAF